MVMLRILCYIIQTDSLTLVECIPKTHWEVVMGFSYQNSQQFRRTNCSNTAAAAAVERRLFCWMFRRNLPETREKRRKMIIKINLIFHILQFRRNCQMCAFEKLHFFVIAERKRENARAKKRDVVLNLIIDVKLLFWHCIREERGVLSPWHHVQWKQSKQMSNNILNFNFQQRQQQQQQCRQRRKVHCNRILHNSCTHRLTALDRTFNVTIAVDVNVKSTPSLTHLMSTRYKRAKRLLSEHRTRTRFLRVNLIKILKHKS